MRPRIRPARALATALAVTLAGAGTALAAEGHPLSDAFTFAGKEACDYYLDGTMPTFRRSQPISADDPLADTADEDDLVAYSYGYAFDDVNGYYVKDDATGTWEGEEPVMDTGVLIGGNAHSKHDATELDHDANDFAQILPYATISVDAAKMTLDEGEVVYEFNSDDFNFNDSSGKVPDNVTLKGNTTLTSYQQKFPDVSYPRKHDSERPQPWSGVIYTGGIGKTIEGKARSGETVVHNQDGSALFTVRYVGAACDRLGRSLDVVLSFTRLTFVAESDVSGPLAILSDSSLCVAPILYEDDHYLIVIDDDTNKVDVHDEDGVRIGARFEFDYRIEDADGNAAHGLVLYSMDDLDNASMATMLATDADWGTNALGNDFRWAEGFGVVRGAASFAVLPYYNHEMLDVYDQPINNLNGDDSLLRVSRMADTVPDGTANGLYFTTSITSVSGTGARNDANTLDTGVAMLIEPSGSMVAALSAGRRGDVSERLFDSGVADTIRQSCSEGGTIVSLDRSLPADGAYVENADYLKVVGSGSTSRHRFTPDQGYHVASVTIDGFKINYLDLVWRPDADGTMSATVEVTEEYGRSQSSTPYTLTLDDDTVSMVFSSVQDDHEIYVEFVPNGLFGMFRVVGTRTLIAIFLVAGFLLLALVATLFWMFKGKDENRMPDV